MRFLPLLMTLACTADALTLPVSQAPPGWMEVLSSPMLPGREVTIEVGRVPRNTDIHIYIGGDVGAPICPPELGGECLDLGGPLFIAQTTTGNNVGRAFWTFPVPMSAPTGLQVKVQAATDFADTVWNSNLVGRTVLDGALDEDGDGLTNDEEVDLGTDPENEDSDGDRVGDWVEIDGGTDPLDEDSDGDDLSDGQEDDLGTDPLDRDSDDDGVRDDTELIFGSDPLMAESDGDGIDDYTEIYVLRTNPSSADTDGDGCDDNIDNDPRVASPTCAPTLAFITSGSYTGEEIGGLAGADAICQAEATDASLGGTWRAYLSSGSTDAISRIASTNATGPWLQVDGTVAFDSLTALTGASSGLILDAYGVLGEVQVWTGSTANGLASGVDCGGWTSATLGTSGLPGLSGDWLDAFNSSCMVSQALYCLEIP